LNRKAFFGHLRVESVEKSSVSVEKNHFSNTTIEKVMEIISRSLESILPGKTSGGWDLSALVKSKTGLNRVPF